MMGDGSVSNGSTGSGVTDHRTAAAIAEAGLAAVFAPDVVARMREDSPLSALGLTPADLVCVSDAVADAAVARGRVCLLDDADLDGLESVADLVRAIQRRADAAAT